jgi:hypothetical protein
MMTVIKVKPALSPVFIFMSYSPGFVWLFLVTSSFYTHARSC